MKITTLLTLFCFISIQAQKSIATKPITVTTGIQHTIQSSNLNEERKLYIHTPEDYQKADKKYPVIYVLDGNNHFQHSVNAVNILQENELIPESIIVAIPNNPGTRGRDLARQRNQFQQFIEREVIPLINQQYRTTNHKTIFGHSMAGAFVLNYLTTKPSLFDNYIAASPVIQIFNAELLTKFEKLFTENKTLSKSLYFTLTGVEAEGQRATDALNKFVSILKNNAPKSLQWKYDYIENQVHMTTPYLTLYQGLSYVFNDYQAPRYLSYNDYNNQGGMNTLQSYYAKRAQKYQTSELIPENTLRRLANILLNDKQTDKALALFKKNIKNYPESAAAYNSLGRAYETLNDHANALKAYQKAVNLAEKQTSPNTGYFTRQLQRVQKEIKG